jgi:hypothetical protein
MSIRLDRMFRSLALLSKGGTARVSHIVTIQTQVRDAAAVAAACQRLGLPSPRAGTARLFGGEATGLIIELPGWKYPLVCELSTGTLKFDNFGGQWGSQVALDRFLQRYACEKARIEARRRGHSVTEQSLADGSIKLTIEVAGGAA